jgi:hypothetical protein
MASAGPTEQAHQITRGTATTTTTAPLSILLSLQHHGGLQLLLQLQREVQAFIKAKASLESDSPAAAETIVARSSSVLLKRRPLWSVMQLKQWKWESPMLSNTETRIYMRLCSLSGR